MDGSEVDFGDPEMFSGSSLECSYPSSSNTDMENFLEELMRNTRSCTHTHTCNPATGTEKKHTHTCYHTHTQLFAPKNVHKTSDEAECRSEVQSEMQPPLGKKNRPVGNREAVKKYREKKKAHTAHLEEEVQRLKAINAQLFKRLQGQAAREAEVVRLRPFEAEVKRLRGLLSEFRGRIDGELGSCYMYQHQTPAAGLAPVGSKDVGHCTMQPLPGGFYLNSITVPCDAEVQCLHSFAPSETFLGKSGNLGQVTETLEGHGQSMRGGPEDQLGDNLWLRECETDITSCQLADGQDKQSPSRF